MSVFDIFSCPLNGRHLIDASAGTGKTYTISALVVRLLIEKELPIERILIVTYTEAATADLKSRVREMIRKAQDAFVMDASDEPFLREMLNTYTDHRISQKRLAAALRDFDLAAIFTIHGFCRQMLVDNSMESGVLFDTELVADLTNLKKDVVHDFYRKNFYTAPLLFVKYCRGKKITPGSLLAFLNNCLPFARLHIIPEYDRDEIEQAIRKAIDAFSDCFSSAANLWSTSGQEVREILQETTALKGNMYKKTSMPNWFVAMDHFLGASAPAPVLFEKFVKFTVSGIKAALKKDHEPPEHAFFTICEDLYAAGRELEEVFGRAVASLKRELVDFAAHEFERRKEQENIFSFDDLLLRLHQGLCAANGSRLGAAIRNKYPVALIDEFQDTDPIQYEIFSAIYNSDEHSLFLIGDPKQAIYSFRGADIFSYIKATRDHEDRFTLEENWRSSPELLKAVNALFENRENPFVFDEISFDAVKAAEKKDRAAFYIDGDQSAPFHIWLALRESAENKTKLIAKESAQPKILAATASEIVRLLNLGLEGRARIGERNLSGGDIAVLVRTNSEAQQVRQALAEYQVATALHSTENLFLSHEASQLKVLLAAVAAPGNSRLIRAALVTDFIGVNAGELYELLENETEFEAWRIEFTQCHQLWRQYGFMRMASYLLAGRQVRQRLLALDGGERRLTNLLHLVEILHRAEFEDDHGMSGLMKFLDEKLAAAEEEKLEEHQLRLESDADRVQVVTVHKAKGLQYPIVFCPFSWQKPGGYKDEECLFHQRDEANRFCLDLGSELIEEHRNMSAEEKLAENMRLVYVALTRAQERCYLVCGALNGASGSGLSYLLHGGEAVEVDMTAVNDAKIINDIERLADRADGSIAVKDLEQVIDSTGTTFAGNVQAPDELYCRQFNRRIENSWRVTSFSGLSYGSRHPASNVLRRRAPASGNGEERSIFTFPQGAKPGTFLHDLLEHVDFLSVNEIETRRLIGKKLADYGYDSAWQNVLVNMLNDIVTMPLHPGNSAVRLAQVGSRERLNEMEFYFPVAKLTNVDLYDVFSKEGNELAKQFAEKLRNLDFPEVRGFLKGFVDLIFVNNCRYYIVDWKSNFLGMQVEDYAVDRLTEVMVSELYILQYYIYTLALHLHLTARLPGYDYLKNFGGVFYIFLRGVHQQAGTDFGIFRDHPSLEIVSALADILVKSTE